MCNTSFIPVARLLIYKIYLPDLVNVHDNYGDYFPLSRENNFPSQIKYTSQILYVRPQSNSNHLMKEILEDLDDTFYIITVITGRENSVSSVLLLYI